MWGSSYLILNLWSYLGKDSVILWYVHYNDSSPSKWTCHLSAFKQLKMQLTKCNIFMTCLEIYIDNRQYIWIWYCSNKKQEFLLCCETGPISTNQKNNFLLYLMIIHPETYASESLVNSFHKIQKNNPEDGCILKVMRNCLFIHCWHFRIANQMSKDQWNSLISNSYLSILQSPIKT